jgi:hypothetical protein
MQREGWKTTNVNSLNAEVSVLKLDEYLQIIYKNMYDKLNFRPEELM